MTLLINKDGLSVTNNPRAIHDELFRGTGYVIGEGASVFIQNESITEKYIVVFKDISTPSERRFIASRYKEALELFQQWLND
ncbi:MAG: hypothetical protein HOF21_12735 [Nitrospina sp.]|jgi:hypothetical protein|nr:hypothetical protein [Nitrospina sp.]MBT5633122.1 hypothetical protein [Nitrospina sp.]